MMDKPPHKEVTLLATIREQIKNPPKTQLRLVAKEWLDEFIQYVEVLTQLNLLGWRKEARTSVQLHSGRHGEYSTIKNDEDAFEHGACKVATQLQRLDKYEASRRR